LLEGQERAGKCREKRMAKWMRNGHGRVNQATDIDLNDLTFDQKVRRKTPRTEAESAAASGKKGQENCLALDFSLGEKEYRVTLKSMCFYWVFNKQDVE